MSDHDRPLAGRGRRLLASLIDACLVPALTVLLILVTGILESAEAYRDQMWVAQVLGLSILGYLMLNGYLLWSRGQTVGKAMLGLIIVNSETGEQASIWRLILIRAWFFPVLFLTLAPPLTILPLIDLVPIFFGRRRCLHDFLAGTMVVTRE